MQIVKYGRLFYWVQSETRKNLWHLVDLEPPTDGGSSAANRPDWRHWPQCSCEAFIFNATRPCKHIIACLEHWAHKLIFERNEEGPKTPDPVKPKKRVYILKPSKTHAPTKATNPHVVPPGMHRKHPRTAHRAGS